MYLICIRFCSSLSLSLFNVLCRCTKSLILDLLESYFCLRSSVLLHNTDVVVDDAAKSRIILVCLKKISFWTEQYHHIMNNSCRIFLCFLKRIYIPFCQPQPGRNQYRKWSCWTWESNCLTMREREIMPIYICFVWTASIQVLSYWLMNTYAVVRRRLYILFRGEKMKKRRESKVNIT